MGTRFAAYCRISDDRRGEGLGVKRQEQDCRALAAAKGCEIVATFVDNDVSAYSGKPRPQYAALVDGVRRGEYDGIIAWHPDRLHRSPKELETFIEVVEAHGVAVETCQAGAWDLATPSGRLIARQLGIVARYESEHKSERVRRALEQNADQGAAHGRCVYGWTREWEKDPRTGRRRGHDVINPTQGDVVKGIAERIVKKDSLRAIAADLNVDGVPSPTGKPWRKGMVRALVLRERNVGFRVYQGKVIGNGDWEPILERGLWEQVRAVLGDEKRRTSSGSAAAHLLSGIACCGKCGAPVRAALNRATPSYRCSERGCVARNRLDVDRLVTETIVGWLSQPEAAAAFASERSPDIAAAEEKAREIRARLDTATDLFVDGGIDRRQLERATARLRPMLEAAEAAARVIDDRPLLTGLLGASDVRVVWDGLPLTRRRAIVDLLVEVRILPSRPGTRSFDPRSVEIVWRA